VGAAAPVPGVACALAVVHSFNTVPACSVSPAQIETESNGEVECRDIEPLAHAKQTAGNTCSPRALPATAFAVACRSIAQAAGQNVARQGFLDARPAAFPTGSPDNVPPAPRCVGTAADLYSCWQW
jgi:hypothetical protein